MAAARAAPLSAKKAMLAVLLADAFADRLLAAADADGDILASRTGLAAQSPALALVFALASMQPNGPRLLTEAVAVPIADYARLSVEDFMVSVYNGHTVQRVLIANADGGRHDVHDVLRTALEDLRERSR